MKYLFVTDLDNTLVGDESGTLLLNHYLNNRREQFYIVYATGRSYDSANQLMLQEKLLEPDYWVVSVGSEIYHQDRLDLDWATHLSDDWDRNVVEAIAQSFPFLTLQPYEEQNPWKVSFFVEPGVTQKHIQELKKELKPTRLKTQIIFSSGRDLDILPARGNKGNAIAYLQACLSVSPESTLVCGDSGNDISLFQQPGKGVIVSNAQEELLDWYFQTRKDTLYLSQSPYAHGILEALKHYQFLG
ncbi:MAG: Mannosylfructose-phosphate phosphatase [Chroococcopsis gigantea SAG 12.99]|jgi:sucrose-6F-phosphate phosphohydrolase|nr:Mannosylfructose-phosphate phosphatase [Chroococcopsis gigantea SAG 12.99]